jgi:uncharacterized membrane protein
MRLRGLRERCSGRFERLQRSRWAHIVFQMGIFLKGFDGILEVVGGFVLLSISRETITHVMYILLQPEFAEDPNDWLATRLLQWTLHLSAGTQIFAVVYLLVHGIIKLVIVAALQLSQLWAYWLAGIVFSLFVVYQLGHFFYNHSITMLVLTVVDLVIIILLPPEYRHLKLEIQERKKGDWRSEGE